MLKVKIKINKNKKVKVKINQQQEERKEGLERKIPIMLIIYSILAKKKNWILLKALIQMKK